MLVRSLQPDNDVLCAELTLFRNHFRENKLEIETIAEVAYTLSDESGQVKDFMTNQGQKKI